MTNEIWKPIPGYPLYEISDKGRVLSLKRNYPWFLKPFINPNGYAMVNLKQNKKGKTWFVHQLVMLAFIGPCPDGMEVCHNDSNPSNNNLGNLRYDTHQNNMGDKSNQYYLGRLQIQSNYTSLGLQLDRIGITRKQYEKMLCGAILIG